MEYLITVVFNTRKKVQKLRKSLHSFIINADKTLNNYEFIIKVDFDDYETLEYIKEFNNQNLNISFIVNSRKQGYISLKDHVDDMTDLAKGKYIMMACDDILMFTPNWNRVLEKYLNDFKIYFLNYQEIYPDQTVISLENKPVTGRNYSGTPWVSYGKHYVDFIFPIYPKKLKELWGTICPHTLVDNWLGDIAKIASIEPYNINFYEFIEEITIETEIASEENSPEAFENYLFYLHHPIVDECIRKVVNFKS